MPNMGLMNSWVKIDLPKGLDLAITLNSGQAFRWQRTGPDEPWSGFIGDDLVLLWPYLEGLWIDSYPLLPINIIERVRDYLRLDDDLPAIQHRLSGDPHVASAIRAFPGLRLLRQDPWETLAAFILSSTNNMKRITLIVENLASALGAPVDMRGITRNTFPAPQRIVQAGEKKLRYLGCGFRAPYLLAAAQAIISGDLPLYQLRNQPYDLIHQQLTRLYGVGDKIADCTMLFSLDRLDAFPIDRWVQRALEHWYGIEPSNAYTGVREWARSHFGGDAGYANQYLFWTRRQIGGLKILD